MVVESDRLSPVPSYSVFFPNDTFAMTDIYIWRFRR
jgi:hypothetical protein